MLFHRLVLWIHRADILNVCMFRQTKNIVNALSAKGAITTETIISHNKWVNILYRFGAVLLSVIENLLTPSDQSEIRIQRHGSVKHFC